MRSQRRIVNTLRRIAMAALAGGVLALPAAAGAVVPVEPRWSPPAQATPGHAVPYAGELGTPAHDVLPPMHPSVIRTVVRDTGDRTLPIALSGGALAIALLAAGLSLSRTARRGRLAGLDV